MIIVRTGQDERRTGHDERRKKREGWNAQQHAGRRDGGVGTDVHAMQQQQEDRLLVEPKPDERRLNAGAVNYNFQLYSSYVK